MGDRGGLKKPSKMEEVTVSKLFDRYSAQIELLERELKSGGISSNMSLAQRLPRHLRRRAASHNPRRVPRSVREKFSDVRAKNEATSTAAKKKKPSRRFRRKPVNLRAAYTKRQGKIKWLQTHIWYAKRFHMVEKWGWRLPNYATDKGLKSSIRALKSEAIMTDISFSSIIELSGSKSDLINLLNQFVPSALGRPYAQDNFWKEKRHCSLILYSPNKVYPLGALGHCTALFSTSGDNSKVWLCSVHPLIVTQLIPLLRESSANVSVDEISEQLSTIRFFGPRIHFVLSNALNLPEKKLIDLPAGFYLEAVVLDPRPNIPVKIKPIIATERSGQKVDEAQRVLNVTDHQNSLFEQKNRKSANLSRIADHLVSSRRKFAAKSADPPAAVERVLVEVPLFIVRSANWCDVIVPSAWTTAFFVAFVYNGARVGGLRELQSLPSELCSLAGGLHLNSWPDARPAALQESNAIESQFSEEYYKRPPAKRVNYRKLAILRPFVCPWQELVLFWRVKMTVPGTQTEFYVLREFMVLRQVADDVNRKLHISRELVSRHANCLVPVQLLAGQGGTPQPFGLICLPPEKELSDDDEPMHELDESVIPLEAKDAAYTFGLNSRQIIGFIVTGGYSFVAGEGRAVGFVSLLGLDVLLRCRRTNMVEFRAASERHYWSARLGVITNPKL